MKTGYIVATVVVVGGLIYVLTRKPGKIAPGASGNAGTGAGASTTNAVLGLVTAGLNFGGKLLPKSSNSSSTSPGPGNNSGLNFSDFYPGNDTQYGDGSGIADGGT